MRRALHPRSRAQGSVVCIIADPIPLRRQGSTTNNDVSATPGISINWLLMTPISISPEKAPAHHAFSPTESLPVEERLPLGSDPNTSLHNNVRWGCSSNSSSLMTTPRALSAWKRVQESETLASGVTIISILSDYL